MYCSVRICVRIFQTAACLHPPSLQNSSFLEERGSKTGSSHYRILLYIFVMSFDFNEGSWKLLKLHIFVILRRILLSIIFAEVKDKLTMTNFPALLVFHPVHLYSRDWFHLCFLQRRWWPRRKVNHWRDSQQTWRVCGVRSDWLWRPSAQSQNNWRALNQEETLC